MILQFVLCTFGNMKICIVKKFLKKQGRNLEFLEVVGFPIKINIMDIFFSMLFHSRFGRNKYSINRFSEVLNNNVDAFLRNIAIV